MEEDGVLLMAGICFWHASEGAVIPNPVGDERVILASHLLHGMALPPSEFFCEVLDYYGLQPHNIVPSSVLVLAGFQALFEGYLGLRPRLDFSDIVFVCIVELCWGASVWPCAVVLNLFVMSIVDLGIL